MPDWIIYAGYGLFCWWVGWMQRGVSEKRKKRTIIEGG